MGTVLVESRHGSGPRREGGGGGGRRPSGGGRRPSGGDGGRELKVSFEWGGVRRSGRLVIDEMESVAELLEAVVELGEALIDTSISAQQTRVHYVDRFGHTKRMYVSKTSLEDLLDARELIVTAAR